MCLCSVFGCEAEGLGYRAQAGKKNEKGPLKHFGRTGMTSSIMQTCSVELITAASPAEFLLASWKDKAGLSLGNKPKHPVFKTLI